MANLKRKDNKLTILNVAKNPIIAYAVTPLARAIGNESFAVSAWILATIDVLIEPSNDDTGRMSIKFAKLF